MATILVVTDSRSSIVELRKITRILSKKHRLTQTSIVGAAENIQKKWGAILLHVDSIRSIRKLIKNIRRNQLHASTPIVCCYFHGISENDLYVVNEMNDLDGTVKSALKS